LNDVVELVDLAKCIPADDRNLCLPVGMALKSKFGEQSFDLWAQWNEQDESWNEKGGRNAWKSIRAKWVCNDRLSVLRRATPQLQVQRGISAYCSIVNVALAAIYQCIEETQELFEALAKREVQP
jgi:hypothetical protein